MTDSILKALEQIRALGLIVETLEVDDKRHRVDVEGQRKGKKPGWYICSWLRLDNGINVVVGAFGIFVGDENQRYKLKFLDSSKINDGERIRWQEKQKKAAEEEEAERQLRAQECAVRAKGIWDKLPQLGSSNYLDRKKARKYGIRFGRGGSVAIPLRNASGLLVSLQWIQDDGTKKFLSGTPKKGAFHLIGTISDALPLVFAEGYATGASIHEATGWPVVVCFDCGNLLPVAEALRPLHAEVRYIFAGDDDHQKPENAGRKKAGEAAKHFGAVVLFPVFKDANGRTDFNDLHTEQGIEVLRAQLKDGFAAATPASQGDPENDPLRGKLNWGDRGLRPLHSNVMAILQEHKQWEGVFGYNQFANQLVKRKKTPYGSEPGPLRDADEVEIAAWFGRKDTYSIGISTTMVRESVLAVAERQPFHPVREYLNSLKWDRTLRVNRFFSTFCGTEHTEVVEAFARNFFLQAVARIFRPGCQARLMLVLEGEQDLGKSTIARVLGGDSFYADVGTSPSDKDFFQIIQGCWIVEISEMASFVRAETSHIKRAVSVATDRFRKSYGHNVEDFPRQCVFFGTVNNQDWQRDETGGTRFMPVWINSIDLDGIRAARDQLWAEAVHRYRSGEPWHIMPEAAREAQEERYLEDPWAEPTHRWLEGKCANERYRSLTASPVQKTTVSELLGRALDVDVKKQDRSAQTRAGNLLRRMGWRMRQVWIGKTKIRIYERPVADKESEKGP